jgi:hypothetical protein
MTIGSIVSDQQYKNMVCEILDQDQERYIDGTYEKDEHVRVHQQVGNIELERNLGHCNVEMGRNFWRGNVEELRASQFQSGTSIWD